MSDENKRGLSALSNGVFLGLLALGFSILVLIGFLIGPPKPKVAARPKQPSIPRQPNAIDANGDEQKNEPEEPAPLVLGEPSERLPTIEYNEEEIRPTRRLGSEHDETSFTDNAPAGGLLVGTRVVFDMNRSNGVVGLQPIYQVAEKYELGRPIGREDGHVEQFLAKPGYAVGQLEGVEGGGADGIRLRFCRINKNSLKADDSYESPWLGQQRGQRRSIGNGANFVVGIFGEADEHHVTSLGLRRVDSFERSLVKADVPLPTWSIEGGPAPVAASDRSEAETFRDMAPDGAVLVGMRVSEGKSFGKSVQAVQPIYQVADAYRLGKWCGMPDDDEKVLLAKPGFVVSRINTRAGLVIDALQLEFANAERGQITAKDSYTSEWVGGDGGQNLESKPKSGLIIGISGSGKESLESLAYYVVATKTELWDPAAETVAEAPVVPAESPAVPVKEEREEKESKPSDPVRTWTSANGANRVEARLLSMAQGQVVIETPQGRQIKVPLEKLSEADQKYVEDWRKRRLLGR
jgi:SLA1 Homology Domain 1 (SHD1) protein